MSSTGSRVRTDIDFTRDGKHQSYLRVPVSTNSSAYGTVPIPITVVKRGQGPTILITGGVPFVSLRSGGRGFEALAPIGFRLER